MHTNTYVPALGSSSLRPGAFFHFYHTDRDTMLSNKGGRGRKGNARRIFCRRDAPFYCLVFCVETYALSGCLVVLFCRALSDIGQPPPAGRGGGTALRCTLGALIFYLINVVQQIICLFSLRCVIQHISNTQM